MAMNWGQYHCGANPSKTTIQTRGNQTWRHGVLENPL
jgi:hypothetical protein